ncbi:hypothetical protein IWW52_001508 [Coemansia sp. RSA 2704]|nr:hypothetical protein IWW54_001891 [Coemansia sp. RSA 2705]KAJ2320212.1 hypothetical protein IWW52_001508 [Coemansia sp. RSA 2704]
MMRVDMGEHLPREAVSYSVTNSTQYMYGIFKVYFQYYRPSPQIAESMSKDALQQSLVALLRGCPLAFARLKIRPDRSICLDYDPENSNNPVLEFHHAAVSYAELEARGFLLADANRYGLDLPPLDGTITESFDQPLLLFKVSYLSDGGVALFSSRHHVLFDGNALFSFVSNWAHYNRMLLQQPDTKLSELPPYQVSIAKGNGRAATFKPAEISMDTLISSSELKQSVSRIFRPPDAARCVFRIAIADVRRLKQQVADSGVLDKGEWVSSNNALAAFIAQCIARAYTSAGIYEQVPSWSVYHSLDMRRLLDLPLRGIGSPLILTDCPVPTEELADAEKLPHLTVRIRRNIQKYTADYLRGSLNWIDATYTQLASDGIQEPWTHIWSSLFRSNALLIGVSCMNKLPVYESDFGAGRPAIVRSPDFICNYIIALPTLDADAIHLSVSLRAPVMRALRADSEWNALCTLDCDS